MKTPHFFQFAARFLVFVFAVAGVVSAQEAKDSDPKIISAPEFKLSSEAEAAGIEGSLKIRATIKKDGSVKLPKIVAGLSWPCGQNAKEELNQVRNGIRDILLAAKFSPAIKDGKPVDKDVMLTYAIGEAYRQAQRKRALDEAKASGKPLPLMVKGGVLTGKAISLPRPEYSGTAKANGIGGAVIVELVIGEDGNVVSAGAVSGHPMLHEGARDAACKARFAPSQLSGVPVKVSGVITYNFVPGGIRRPF